MSSLNKNSTIKNIEWGKIQNPLIFFGSYAIVLWLIYMKIPSLWESFFNPQSFFILINLGILSSILLITITKKKFLGYLLLVMIFLAVLINYVGCFSINKTPSSAENSNNTENSQPQQNYYPTSGTGMATQDMPIKAYLDPQKSYTRIPSGKDDKAKYVLESDPSKFFIANEKPGKNSKHINDWYSMPAGNYLIYPYPFEKKSIIFKWWQ